MFADPQSVTVSAAAKSLPRVSQVGRVSKYENTTEGLALDISHRITPKQSSRLVKVTKTKIAPDPLDPTVNQQFSMSCHVVIQTPAAGFTEAEVLSIAKALRDYCSDANLTKVIAGES